MDREEEEFYFDEADTDIHGKEYGKETESDLDDFEEEEAQPLMIALVSLGVVIVLAIVVSIIVLFCKSDRGAEEEYVSLIESEQETSTEEQITSVSMEDEAITIAANEGVENVETEIKETVSNAEQKEEMANEQTEGIEIQESSSATEEASQSEQADIGEEPVSGTASMEFTEISDTVTAKDVTNLRSVPSTLDEGNIVSQLMNGETVLRTGINDTTGWSRLDYNGQVVYAVSNYLTTDLNYKTPVAPSDPNRVATQDGRIIIFTDHDDYVTPKEYVNLRVEPSTSEGEATVRCQINNGDTVHRTGYSPDSGWSRVEYNGEILYVVSSMIYSTE